MQHQEKYREKDISLKSNHREGEYHDRQYETGYIRSKDLSISESSCCSNTFLYKLIHNIPKVFARGNVKKTHVDERMATY